MQVLANKSNQKGSIDSRKPLCGSDLSQGIIKPFREALEKDIRTTNGPETISKESKHRCLAAGAFSNDELS